MGVIPRTVAVATVKALILKLPGKKSFKRVGFVRRQAMAGKVDISEKLKTEKDITYLYCVVENVERRFHHPR